MPTSYMKLPYEEKVLRSDALRDISLDAGVVGFSLDVGLNYYRGMPLSSVEELELRIDGSPIPDHLLLFEYDGKLFPLTQLRIAFSEFWSVKKSLRILVYNNGLDAGDHTVELRLLLRVVYMQFAPGIWGKIDNSASATLTLQEASE